jgi:hypothetical protein
MRFTVPLPSQWRCQGCLDLTIPYLTTAKAFTRDLNSLNLHHQIQILIFNLIQQLKPMILLLMLQMTISYLLRLYCLMASQRKFRQIIHRLMRNFTEVNDNLLQYKEATLK